MLKSVCAIVVAAGLLAACGQQSAPAPTAPGTQAGQPGAPVPDAPVPNAPAPGTPGGGQATTQPAAPLPTVEPGVFRVGNFAARVEGATLSRGSADSGSAKLSFTLTLFNTGAEPISLISMNPNHSNTSALLDTGLSMSTNGGAPGLLECFRNEPSGCRESDVAKYTQIDPGGSSTVNVELFAYTPSDQIAALPQVKTATYSMRLHLLQGATVDRPVQLSISGIPVRVIG